MAALGLIEIQGFSPAMVAVDVMTKAARVTLFQVELNDLYGACIKLTGETAAVAAAVQAGRDVAERMHAQCVSRIINSPDPAAEPAYAAPAEFSPLIEQDVVHTPRVSTEIEEQMKEQVP
jgi:microcompartment protein CcmL/EutN